MKKEEANKIIAEFMEYKSCYNCKHTVTKGGPKYYHQYHDCDYTDFWDNEPCEKYEPVKYPEYSKSLDKLVPVWEKLGMEMLTLFNWDIGYHVDLMLTEKNKDPVCANSGEITGTPQELAAIATAKAIQELK